MSQFLLYYQRPEPATWVYFSSFLTIGLYFVFHRFWSIRNLDILLLILLAPGILMVHEGRKQRLEFEAAVAGENPLIAANQRPLSAAQLPVNSADNSAANSNADALTDVTADAAEKLHAGNAGLGAETLTAVQQTGDTAEAAGLRETEVLAEQISEAARAASRLELRGFLWLLVVEFVILVRLFIDPLMVRRPLLDPNLTTGGLAFIGVSMLVFLMANVINSTPQLQREQGPQLGPGYPVLNMLPAIPTIPDGDQVGSWLEPPANQLAADQSATVAAPPQVAYAALARTLAILAHLAVVVGITLVAHLHFGNFKAGAGCATLYLILPYTAQMTGRVDHVLPAALLVWAVLLYRRPLLAGICLGLAAGLVYYPAFLLPLWLGFYRQRGLGRFTAGVFGTILVLTVLLSLGGSDKFFERLIQMYGLWLPLQENLEGVWGLGWQPIWRFPVLVAFALISGLYAVWPRQKNLGTLISCSAALMVAAQFWHGFGGGLFIGWFVPLMLLTIFRPNLEDRVAVKVLGIPANQRKSAERIRVEAA